MRNGDEEVRQARGEAAHWPYYMYQPFDLPKSIFNFARRFLVLRDFIMARTCRLRLSISRVRKPRPSWRERPTRSPTTGRRTGRLSPSPPPTSRCSRTRSRTSCARRWGGTMIDTTPRVRKAEQLAKKEERKAKAAPSAGAPKRKELKSRGAAMSVAPGGRGFKCPGGPATRSSTRRRRRGRPGRGQMKMRVARAMTTSELPSPSEQTRPRARQPPSSRWLRQ